MANAPPSTSKRVPPPQLFQAPTTASTAPSTPSSSTGTTKHNPPSQLRPSQQHGSVDLPAAKRPQVPSQNTQASAAGIAEENRVDALWAKMQLTLEEVELSALGSTHIFGAAHNTALEQLREAQIALAKAWGRGEVDEEFEAMDAAWAADHDPTASGEGETLQSGDIDDEKGNAEAKKRRQANDKFFKKVNDGVIDVVGKLDGVAAAMAKVEKESREIWDDQDSMESSSSAT